jgi:hypothetical protein
VSYASGYCKFVNIFATNRGQEKSVVNAAYAQRNALILIPKIALFKSEIPIFFHGHPVRQTRRT